MNDKPQHLYSISWTQPYDHFNGLNTEELANRIIESLIDHGDLADAQKALERIMKL